MATPEEWKKARKQQSAYQKSGEKAFAKIAKSARATAAAKKISGGEDEAIKQAKAEKVKATKKQKRKDLQIKTAAHKMADVEAKKGGYIKGSRPKLRTREQQKALNQRLAKVAAAGATAIPTAGVGLRALRPLAKGVEKVGGKILTKQWRTVDPTTKKFRLLGKSGKAAHKIGTTLDKTQTKKFKSAAKVHDKTAGVGEYSAAAQSLSNKRTSKENYEMNNPREFIDNIADNDNLEAEMHFTNIMIDKVGSSLEDRRYDLANDLVNEKKEMTANQILRDTGKKKPKSHWAGEISAADAELDRILRTPTKRKESIWHPDNATANAELNRILRGKKKDPDPTRSDAKGKRKGDLPKRTGDGGVAADMEIAGGKAPSKPNKELDIGAGPKKPSKKPQVGTGDQHGRSKTKKPKVVQPGDTKHPLDTSDIESGATGGQPKKPQVGTGDHHPTKKPGRSPGALGGRRPPKKSDRVFDFE